MYRPDIPRTGIGYDVHRFAEGRRCVLGGVEIPHERGLLGHSDADVVLRNDGSGGANSPEEVGRRAAAFRPILGSS